MHDYYCIAVMTLNLRAGSRTLDIDAHWIEVKKVLGFKTAAGLLGCWVLLSLDHKRLGWIKG